jgi:HlyD family secretion protein
MNTHIKKISIYGKGIYRQLVSMFLELPRNKQVVVGVAVVILYGTIHLFTSSSEKTEDIVKTPRAVVLRSVSEITNKESSVPLLGIVTSTSEATIRSESSGELTHVYKKLGDYVYAGEIIAEFENSAERAQVQQAEGAYEAAKASRDVAHINNGTTISSLADSKTNALNTLSNAYTAMDDAIHTKTDSAFSDPREINAKFLPIVPSVSLVYSLETTRVEIEKMLTARSLRNKSLTTSDDLASEIVTMQKEVTFVKTYLDDLATAYSKSIPDSRFSQATLDNTKASINITRSTLSGTLSSLSGAKTSLTASTNAEASIGTGTNSGSTGAVDAQVKQALGAYNGALSRLEKTIVRSPISGTLNSLNIQTGDFVTQFSEVAVVSNNGALEVVTYVTDDDAKRIQTGNTVTIAPNIQGVITRIASGIDPTTKKIEVRVGIISKTNSLINGQSVQLRVSRSVEKKTTTNDPISIPLSALKITPTKSLVFTVNASSTLEEIEVTTGAILGEEIQILGGLTQETIIVTDARGLKEGMKVTVSNK